MQSIRTHCSSESFVYSNLMHVIRSINKHPALASTCENAARKKPMVLELKVHMDYLIITQTLLMVLLSLSSGQNNL
jgi:hypothetical protein